MRCCFININYNPAGTSLIMHCALDDSNDVLVAYKQNHRWLTRMP
jgi:hypothetical protein